MCTTKSKTIPLCAHHAREALRDWLQTQCQVTAYWRDLLVESGESEDLIEILDDHAAFLRAASHTGEGVISQLQ